MQKFYFYSLCIMNPFVVFCVVQIKTLLRIIFWNSSLEYSSVHNYNTRASTSEHFYTKESQVNVKRIVFSRVGVKIWNGIPHKQCYSISFKLNTPILMLIRLLWKWKSNSLVLYFHFILFLKFYSNIVPVFK